MKMPMCLFEIRNTQLDADRNLSNDVKHNGKARWGIC